MWGLSGEGARQLGRFVLAGVDLAGEGLWRSLWRRCLRRRRSCVCVSCVLCAQE